MDMGTADYGNAELARARAAQERIPTLADVRDRADMHMTADGSLMPGKLQARQGGWGEEGDRDSEQAAKTRAYVTLLDEMADQWLDKSTIIDDVMGFTTTFANTYRELRKITKGNQGS